MILYCLAVSVQNPFLWNLLLNLKEKLGKVKVTSLRIQKKVTFCFAAAVLLEWSNTFCLTLFM